MSGSTATWAIPYPTGSDSPCSVQATLVAMGMRVDSLCHTFDTEYQRLRRPIYSRVLMSTTYTPTVLPTVQSGDTTLQWDTIDVDTLNMAHIYGQQPFVITTNPMVYMAVTTVNYASSPGANTLQFYLEQGITTDFFHFMMTSASFSPVISFGVGTYLPTGSIDQVGVADAVVPQPAINANNSSFTIYWISDPIV